MPRTRKNSLRASLALALLILAAPVAAAEDPSGCDKFKWPIERERAALTAPDRVKLTSGGELAALPLTGITLALRPHAEAKLPVPPDRAPRNGTFAGFAMFANPPKAGTYAVSVSAVGWIEVVQDGRFLPSASSSAAKDCDGIRKIVKFEIPAKPFAIQITGVETDTISLAILPTPE